MKKDVAVQTIVDLALTTNIQNKIMTLKVLVLEN